jgi:hypothetical protein
MLFSVGMSVGCGDSHLFFLSLEHISTLELSFSTLEYSYATLISASVSSSAGLITLFLNSVSASNYYSRSSVIGFIAFASYTYNSYSTPSF